PGPYHSGPTRSAAEPARVARTEFPHRERPTSPGPVERGVRPAPRSVAHSATAPPAGPRRLQRKGLQPPRGAAGSAPPRPGRLPVTAALRRERRGVVAEPPRARRSWPTARRLPQLDPRPPRGPPGRPAEPGLWPIPGGWRSL